MKEFFPSRFIRHHYYQTYFGSKKKRKKEYNQFIKRSILQIFECSDGTKLQYSSTLPKDKKFQSVFILLHGWEGSMESSYILETGFQFFQKGCKIIRVNYRDHGDTHSWNREPFHAARLSEIYEFVDFVIKQHLDLPVVLVGFSLGGSFAIRIALKQSKEKKKWKNLQKIFSISAPLEPLDSTILMDSHWLLGPFFKKTWGESLELKQKYFPDSFAYSNILKKKNVFEMTKELVDTTDVYENVFEYFRDYTILPSMIPKIKVPLYLLSALDDPIIRAKGYLKLQETKFVKIELTKFGGHNGFLENRKGDRYFVEVIARESGLWSSQS